MIFAFLLWHGTLKKALLYSLTIQYTTHQNKAIVAKTKSQPVGPQQLKDKKFSKLRIEWFRLSQTCASVCLCNGKRAEAVLPEPLHYRHDEKVCKLWLWQKARPWFYLGSFVLLRYGSVLSVLLLIPCSCPWDAGAIQKRYSSEERARGSRAQWAGSCKGGGC